MLQRSVNKAWEHRYLLIVVGRNDSPFRFLRRVRVYLYWQQ